MLKRGWELMGHGNTNSRGVVGLSEDAEREVIESTIREIREFTGQTPQGWLGPGLGETYNTPDLLAEAGIRYVCDWIFDDQPVPMKVRRGSLLAMPYTVELNDIPLFVGQNRTGQQYFEVIRDQFDGLYRDGATTGRVMAISLHPFLTGVPHRAKYLEKALEHIRGHSGVWWARGGEIAFPNLRLATDSFTLTGSGKVDSQGNLFLPARLQVEKDLSGAILRSVEELRLLADAEGRLEIPLVVQGRLPEVSVAPDVGAVAAAIAAGKGEELLGELLQKALKNE